MIEYQRLFHTGVRVHDIEASMTELSGALGVEFCPVEHRQQPLWTPEDGAGTVDLRFTYSREGAQHVELIQAPPGNPWHAGDTPGVHHLGVWADDVAAETERLVERGWRLELAATDPEEGYGNYTYARSPAGMLVELVDGALAPIFEEWWSTGHFPAATG